MTTTLLHAVARKAEAITPDADLLARFTAARDHPAFEELVRRHGPLVWAVCRQMLPHHADAEDAFQAVFLALVRSAASIRDGRTVPAWLHGVAVRVATRARREFARRRLRERRAAAPEADRPVPDAAWDALAAAVHDEVQRLPEAERTAFVLCDLEGVSQPDAAARLGWPLGSLSGRLCRARQRLLERLTARGVAPAAVVGIGTTAGAASALPAKLFDAVKVFPGSPGAASGAVSALARGLTEGATMRLKLTAAVMVAALGVTGGAVVLSRADAQPPEVVKEVKDLLGGLDGQPGGGRPGEGGPPSGGSGGLPGGGGPPAGSGGSSSGPGVGGFGGFAISPPTWEYKFVEPKSHFANAKDDRLAFEETVTKYGKEGWEYVSSEQFKNGNKSEFILVFKRSKGGHVVGGMLGGGPGGGMSGGFGGLGGPGATGASGAGSGAAVPGKPDRDGAMWGQWGGRDGVEVRSFTLWNAAAPEVAAALSRAFPKFIKAAVPEAATNRVLVVADAAMMLDISKAVVDLDMKGAKPGAGGPGPVPMGPGPVGPMGGGGPAPGNTEQTMTVTIFPLKHAEAKSIGATLTTLLTRRDYKPTVAVDERTNSVLLGGDEQATELARKIITELDKPSKPK